jgi:hypothetical protein
MAKADPQGLRFISLDLRADQMPNSAAFPPAIALDVPDNPVVALPESSSRIWLVMLLIGGMALTLLVAVVTGHRLRTLKRLND